MTGMGGMVLACPDGFHPTRVFIMGAGPLHPMVRESRANHRCF